MKNIVVILAEENNIDIITKNSVSLLSLCLKKYKNITSIDYVLISISKKLHKNIEELLSNKVQVFDSQNNKENSLKFLIEEFEKNNKIAETDNILIHDCNYPNTEKRIIDNLITNSEKYNCVNTILPIENSYKLVFQKNNQFLIKNKEEFYYIQSPQLLKFNLFKNIYMDGENVTISMSNTLGSKFNILVKDELDITILLSYLQI